MDDGNLLPVDVGRHNWGDFYTGQVLWEPVVGRIVQAAGLGDMARIDGTFPGYLKRLASYVLVFW